MREVHFITELTECTECRSQLRAYKTTRKTVKFAGGGCFIAVEHIKQCGNGHERIVFRSENVPPIVNRGCTYANDVMLSASTMRFIDGRSCSEIASAMDIGISERHVRRLSNTALEVLANIHEKSGDRLRQMLGRWVLQIDGMVDGEYNMIVAVRDAVGGFVLYAKKCRSESTESIVAVLMDIKSKFGTPVASMSDMRQGILAAMEKAFPGVPAGLCKLHYLRNTGKDIMEYRHTVLGKVLRRLGTKTRLNRVLQSLPPYDSALLEEIGDGYCSDSGRLAVMVSRNILERLLNIKESTGSGFPFSLSHLDFTEQCLSALPLLTELNRRVENESIAEAIRTIESLASDSLAVRIAGELRGIYGLFESLRKAMYPKHKGTPLSDEPVRTNVQMETDCEIVIGALEVYMHADIPPYMFEAAKHIIEQYRKWKSHLFVKELDGIAHTNNSLERVFRKVRRNVRRRCGNMATGHQLTLNGERLVLFQNMGNAAYVGAVFEGRDIAAVFGTERALIPKTVAMTVKRRTQLLETAKKMLLSGSVPDTPYTDVMWAEAQAAR
jgi:hypothetical protein